MLAFVLAWVALMASDSWNAAIAGILIGGVIGHILPERVLDAYIRARGSKMRAALPSALDIIALSIEAGQPMDQAIEASSRELRRVYPELSMEFSGIQRELRAGKSRIEALTDVSNRNREVELKKVCKLLIDGDRFGTTLAPALRNHARYLRLRSRQRAQEAARKVSVKLVFPVFFLIFPAVILITLGPAVIQISTMLNGLF
jgi:tight adherence protein C